MAEQDGQPSLEVDALGLNWVKSSASSEGNPNCVEVAATADRVHVRDSKHPHPTLSFTPETWTAFMDSPLG